MLILMFGLGFWEIIVICIAVIIFIRPEDIPGLAKKAGKLYGEFKKYYQEFFSQFRKMEREIKKPSLPEVPGKEQGISGQSSAEIDKH